MYFAINVGHAITTGCANWWRRSRAVEAEHNRPIVILNASTGKDPGFLSRRLRQGLSPRREGGQSPRPTAPIRRPARRAARATTAVRKSSPRSSRRRAPDRRQARYGSWPLPKHDAAAHRHAHRGRRQSVEPQRREPADTVIRSRPPNQGRGRPRGGPRYRRRLDRDVPPTRPSRGGMADAGKLTRKARGDGQGREAP